MNEKTPIIIPSYEPDERLIELLKDLVQTEHQKIILVDDGSGENYRSLFAQAEELIAPNGVFITYPENKGKGGALKTAFTYVLENMPEVIGVITADSDGQHTPSCIQKVEDSLLSHPDALILGVRDFDTEGVPWKSQVGNKLTIKVLQYISGISVRDTQTGLRGIPVGFLKECLSIKQNRFEYEMEMLLRTRGKVEIIETVIETVYDSKENHQTHFDPIRDSIKIYKVLGKQFLTYIFASLSSSILDLGLFMIFCYFLKGIYPGTYIIISTVVARILSASYNYGMNYKKVFRSDAKVSSSGPRYAVLAILQMLCSAALVYGGVMVFPFLPEGLVKAIVDTLLFFVSYKIQQKYVF